MWGRSLLARMCYPKDAHISLISTDWPPGKNKKKPKLQPPQKFETHSALWKAGHVWFIQGSTKQLTTGTPGGHSGSDDKTISSASTNSVSQLLSLKTDLTVLYKWRPCRTPWNHQGQDSSIYGFWTTAAWSIQPRILIAHSHTCHMEKFPPHMYYILRTLQPPLSGFHVKQATNRCVDRARVRTKLFVIKYCTLSCAFLLRTCRYTCIQHCSSAGERKRQAQGQSYYTWRHSSGNVTFCNRIYAETEKAWRSIANKSDWAMALGLNFVVKIAEFAGNRVVHTD